MAKQTQTHERFIQSVAKLAIRMGDLNPTERQSLSAIKLVYGAGESGLRGITYYGKWKGAKEAVPFVEICAFGQESWIQVAGTTIHELGHVLAGWGAGHSKTWLEACARLGLGDIQAAGTEYKLECFAPKLRTAIEKLAKPDEGEPVAAVASMPGSPLGLPGMFGSIRPKPCGAGIGTRGGKSRGVGSGSRLRLFTCSCEHPVKVRIAADGFDAIHNPCQSAFKRV